MSFARIFWPLGIAAALAACSGNLGGGQSTLPGGPPSGGTSLQAIAAATPTASPLAASNVATIGSSVAPQALPDVQGWGGTIAFPLPSAAPAATPNPKATAAGSAAPAGPVSIGITAAIAAPTDAPSLGTDSKGRPLTSKHGSTGPTGLFFISLLSTADVTLGSYPAIAVNVPRAVAAKYNGQTFGLALFDPQTKAKSYALAVAGRDLSSPVPGTAASAAPTPVPSPTPSGPVVAGQVSFTPPPIGSGLNSAGLPPERIAFLPAAASLTLKANSPAVFALYVVAPPSPSPSPSPKRGSASPGPSAGPTATAAASARPPAGTASPVAGAMATASPSPQASPSPVPLPKAS